MGPSDEELEDKMSRTETLMIIDAEDAAPTPTGATVEDTVPHNADKVANSFLNGLGASKDGDNLSSTTNGDSTPEECRVQAHGGSTPLGSSGGACGDSSAACSTSRCGSGAPARPAGEEQAASSPKRAEVSGAAPAAGTPTRTRPTQPTYETPRRGAHEQSASTTGTQRRQQPCRAEFRPLSSSSKGQDAPRGRGGRHGGRQLQR